MESRDASGEGRLMDIIAWLTDPANWTGQYSIPKQTLMHLVYSFVSLGIALVIAVPLGLYIGHTGRGENLIIGSANAMRALPTIGLLILLVLIMAPRIGSSLAFVIPAIVVLILLAVPPILSGVVSGVQSIDRSVIDAAYGLGLSRRQIVFKVEAPGSLPLALSGVRGAMLQIVSTATVAAYVSLGGLGRYIIDGRAVDDYSMMAGGSVLLIVLAIMLELMFVVITRVVVSPGLTRRSQKIKPT